MGNTETMIAKAFEAMNQAYAPYSTFQVGSCIKTDKGNYYSGCNVENAAYGLTICSETAAIANMVTHGEQCIEEIVVLAKGNEIIVPCGACRQQLNEFCRENTKIHLCGLEGLHKTMTMKELFPFSFGASHLKAESHKAGVSSQ
jgi:cytidine deaminase